MHTRLFAPFAIAFSMAASAALGCGGSAPSEQGTPVNSAATRAPVAQTAHGPVRLVGDALGDVPMTAAQRAQIEQLATDADARHGPTRAARRDLMLAVAAQVEAGRIDRATLQPKIDAVAAAATASQPADRSAIERLHAILGPDQRTAFVDALEARIHDHMGEAHNGPMMPWARELKLSDDQREQIKAAVQHARSGAHEQGGAHPLIDHKERGAKLLDAFKKDRFVLDEVAPAQDVARQATRTSEMFLVMAEAVLPILTPEQLAMAAQKLRARAETESAGRMMP